MNIREHALKKVFFLPGLIGKVAQVTRIGGRGSRGNSDNARKNIFLSSLRWLNIYQFPSRNEKGSVPWKISGNERSVPINEWARLRYQSLSRNSLIFPPQITGSFVDDTDIVFFCSLCTLMMELVFSVLIVSLWIKLIRVTHLLNCD